MFAQTIIDFARAQGITLNREQAMTYYANSNKSVNGACSNILGDCLGIPSPAANNDDDEEDDHDNANGDDDKKEENDRVTKKSKHVTGNNEEAGDWDTPTSTPDGNKKLPAVPNPSKALSPLLADIHITSAAGGKKPAAMPVAGLNSNDDSEDNKDIPEVAMPLSAAAIRGATPITPTDMDIECLRKRRGQTKKSKLTAFVRSIKGTWDSLVDPSDRVIISDGSIKSPNFAENYFSKFPNREDGWNFIKVVTNNHPGRFYRRGDNNIFYEVPKDNLDLLRSIWHSLCNMKYTATQLNEDAEQRSYEYLVSVQNGEDPSLRSDVIYGSKKIVTNKNRSERATDRFERLREEGIVHGFAAENAAAVGKRLIDDVHMLASQNDFSAIMFANRKAILRALDQQDVDENDDDVDDNRYNGFIVTDMKKALERLNFGQDGVGVFLNQLRRFSIKEALCNPCLIKGGVRPLRDGDLFIFHHKDFYDGGQGKEAVKRIHYPLEKVFI